MSGLSGYSAVKAAAAAGGTGPVSASGQPSAGAGKGALAEALAGPLPGARPWGDDILSNPITDEKQGLSWTEEK